MTHSMRTAHNALPVEVKKSLPKEEQTQADTVNTVDDWVRKNPANWSTKLGQIRDIGS